MLRRGRERLQNVWYEKVLSRLRDHFVTETGKVIEGNYDVGELAPIIFDRRFRTYLPAYKEKIQQPVPDPVTKADDVKRRRPLPMVFPVVALAIVDQDKIYFRCQDPPDPSYHFYIDVSGLVAGSYYHLRLIEDRAHLGVLMSFNGDDSVDVIRFRIKEKYDPERKVTYDGVEYVRRHFDHVDQNISLSDDDLKPVLPDPPAVEFGHGAALGHISWFEGPVIMGYGTACPGHSPWITQVRITWTYEIDEVSPGYWSHSQSLLAEVGHITNYGWMTYVKSSHNLSQHWGLNIYAVTKMGIYNHPYAGRAIAPIGAVAWAVGDTHNDLRYKIFFSINAGVLVTLRYHWYSSGTPTHYVCSGGGEVDIGGGVQSYETFKFQEFGIPLLLVRDKDGWTHIDAEGLYSNVWRLIHRLEHGRWYWYAGGSAYHLGWFLSVGNTGYQVMSYTVSGSGYSGTFKWAAPAQWPGRYKRVWGYVNGNTLVEPLVHVERTRVRYTNWNTAYPAGNDSWETDVLMDNQVVIVDAADPWGMWCLYYYAGGPFPEEWNNIWDYHVLPPLEVGLTSYKLPSQITAPHPSFEDAIPQRVLHRHAGGGFPGRSMLRFIPTKIRPQAHARWSGMGGPAITDKLFPDEVSREILRWSSEYAGNTQYLPRLNTVADDDGSADVTLHHYKDMAKNLVAVDQSPWIGNKTCDVGRVPAELFAT